MGNITIPSVLKIEAGAVKKIGTYLKNADISKVVILFGNGLIDMFGIDVMQSLKDAGVEVLEYQEMDTVALEDISTLAFSMPNKTQAVIGLGGGKVIDAAKYCGYLLKIPFISVPTSSSTDGFSSASASLIVNGRRKSVPAAMAHTIIVDTDVIKSAPKKFLFSGIGDMVSKITALYDWEYEEKQGYLEVNDCAYMISRKAVDSFIRMPFENIEDAAFFKELLDSLSMSGIANEIAGSSLPTSGSEHLISHALDKLLERPQLHGVQVGIATYIMAKVQKQGYEIVDAIFEKTGFWEYVAELDLDVEDYKRAIDVAPSVKPFRHTFLHEEKYREEAKALLCEDNRLKYIFKIS